MIDAQTLREAQKHPGEYRNLLVRVTGCNAHFVGLAKRHRLRLSRAKRETKSRAKLARVISQKR
jgi:pyruvate-formate lyase